MGHAAFQLVRAVTLTDTSGSSRASPAPPSTALSRFLGPAATATAIPSRILCCTQWRSSILIGCSDGALLEYRPAGAAASAAADQSAASAPRVAAGNDGYSLFARKDGFAPSAIMRLEIALPTAAAADSSDAPAAPAASATSGASRAAGVLIALADCVRLAALPSLEPLTCLPRTAGATSLAWDAEGGVLCVAIKRRVLVLRFDGRSTFKEEREFTCPDAPRLLALPSPTTLCAATPTKYLLHHIPPPGTAGSGGSWRDMLPCGQVAPPSVVKLPRGEMLVGKDSIGLFLDASGRPLRSHGINWSRPPSHVAVMPPYALAKLPNYIEVRSLLPGHALVQTIPLREHAALWTPPNLPTATTGAVEGSSRGAGRSARGVFAVAEESVYIVAPVSLAAQRLCQGQQPQKGSRAVSPGVCFTAPKAGMKNVVQQVCPRGWILTFSLRGCGFNSQQRHFPFSLCPTLHVHTPPHSAIVKCGHSWHCHLPTHPTLTLLASMVAARPSISSSTTSSGDATEGNNGAAPKTAHSIASLPDEEKEEHAYYLLMSAVHPQLSLTLAQANTTKDMWGCIMARFDCMGNHAQVALLRDLITTRMDPTMNLTGRQRKLALLSLVVFLAEKRAAAVAAAAAATSSSAPAAAPASATAAADSLEKEGEENEGEEQQSMSEAEATAVVIDTYLSLALQTLTPLPPPLPPSSTLPAPAVTADASAAAAATAAEAAAAAAEAEERAIPHSAPSAAAESPPDSPETAFDFNHSLFSSSGPLTFGQRPSPPPPAATSSSYNTHGSLGSNIKSGDATATVESSSSSNNLGASGGGGGGGVSFEGPLDAASVSRAAAAVTAAASAAAVTAAASAAAVTAAASAAAVTAAASAAAVRTGDGHGQALAIQAAPSEFSPAAVDRFIAALSVQTSLSQPHPPAASPSLVIPNQEGRGVGTDNGLFQMQSEGAGRGGGGASMSAAGVADSADPMHPLRSALHVLWAADNVCHVSTVEAALREEDRWRDVIRFLFFKGLHREGLVFLREMLKGGGVGMGWEGEEGTEPVGRRKGEGEGMEGEGEGGGSGDDDDGGGGDGTRGRRRDADVVENCFKEYVELLGQQPRQQPLVLEALTWRFQDDPTAALALLTSLRHPPPNGGPSSQCLLPRTYLGADRSASPCSQLIFLPQPPPLPTPPDLVLSLIRQVAPHLSASFLQHLLEQTAQAMGEAGGGSGLLSAFLLFLCCCPVVPSPLSLPTRPGALAYSPGGPSPQQHRPPASSSCSFPPSLSTFISPPDLVLSLIRQVAPHLSASFLEHLLEQTAQLPHCSLHVPPCSLPVSHHFPPHLTPPDLVLSLIRQVAPHLSASFLEHLLEQTAQAMGEGGGGEGVEEGEGEDVEEGSGDGWRGSRGSGGGGGESGREGGESGRRWSSSSGAGAPGGGAGGGGVGEVQDVGAAASQLQLDLQWCGCVWRWSRGGSGGAGRGGSGITATARPGELEPLELKFECTREFLRFRVEWILFFTAPVPLG
ncbi:unnamed protein product [Closterium sp. NIES-54]